MVKALFTNGNKIILRAVAAVLAVILTVAAFAFSGCGLMTASNTERWVIKTIKDNYYYYDEMDKDGLEDLSVSEIVKRLDIYSEYYTPEELLALVKDNSGEKAGVGISYIYVEEGKCSIYPEGGCLLVMVVGNSPAEKAGLKKGQLLVGGSYNGQTVRFDTQNAIADFIDPIAEGASFTLTASTGESYTVSKQNYNASYMFMATNASAWTATFNGQGEVNGIAEVQDSETRAIEYLPDGAAYVSMSQFYGQAADEFGYMVKEFTNQHCTSLILDLRDNGGGYVDVMLDMAGYFAPSSKLAMTARDRNGKETKSYSVNHGNNLLPDGTTVYVLANSGTASASEALIGFLISYGVLDYGNIFLSDYSEEFLSWAGEDYKTAQSYGKGIMQTTFTNWLTHEALKLTTAKIVWPNGKCIHGEGVTEAAGCRTVEAEWLVTPSDTELQRIIEMINE
ncbi:MAG: hypothetical protein K2O89_06220 [Clostridia bacterium]|nr:hypothetical protein [Clostridia bacterium]